MGADEQHHRASDAEREAVADRLRAATAEGRLDPAELDERLTAAYAARTRAELAPLTADLPAAPAPPPETPPVWANEAVRHRLAGFLVANVVCIAVWALSDPNSAFWPKWVLLGTGIALFAAIVHAVLDIEEDDHLGRPDHLGPGHLHHGPGHVHHGRHQRRGPDGLPDPRDPPRF